MNKTTGRVIVLTMARRGQNRHRLLTEGLRLFARQGFNATGVQEIADASGVPKGSFYNYFDSKEQFAAEVLARYQEQECAELETLLVEGSGSPLARLRSVFDHWIAAMCDAGFSGGCLAGRLAQELAGEMPELRPHVERVFQCSRGYLADCVREARETGELETDVPDETLAEFIVNAWQGALQRAKAAGSEEPLRTCADVLFDCVLKPGGGSMARASAPSAG